MSVCVICHSVYSLSPSLPPFLPPSLPPSLPPPLPPSPPGRAWRQELFVGKEGEGEEEGEKEEDG